MPAPDTTPPSRKEALRSFTWRLETPAGLAALFGAALLLRLLLAPRTGFWGDLQAFRIWADHLNEVGLRHFYDDRTYREYPPGYLYVLWAIGKVSATPSYLLLKLPSILADLGLAWVAGIFAARLAPAAVKEKWPVRALVVAAVLFNPAFWGLSAVWGQVDSPAALFVLWSLLLLYTSPATLRNEIASFALFAVAFAMKPQSAFVLPVMLYALYRRYLHHRPLSETIDGLLAIAVTGVLSLAVWFATGPLFGLGPLSLVRFYNNSVSASHHYTSANAFNLWGVFGFWRNDATGEHVMSFAGVSAYRIGTLLCLAGIAVALWLAHREIGRGGHEARILTVTTASVTLLSFALLTRVHERYMFVALAGLAPLLFVRPLRIAYVALSALFVLNLWYPYAFFNTQWNVETFRFDPWFDWIFGGLATDTWQRKVLSAAVTAIVIVITLCGARWVGKAELAPAPARFPGSGQAPAARIPPTAGAAASWAAWALARLRNAPAFRDPDRPESITRASRWGPIALVALTCVFGLVVLRGETVYAQNLNDSSFHLQMVGWADGQIREGRVPLDGWYPYLSLGSSQFHHYQSLPHTLTAYAARVTGAADQTAYLWALYLLLALWPISVYAAARLLGATRWTAAGAAAVSPLVVSASGYGFEHGSYVWRGYGVYSQLWGMWLLPLAWGLTWRAVSRGKGYAVAALALALTMACHFILGYLAVLTVGVWVLVGGRAGFVTRLGRAAIVSVGAMLVAAWALVPLLADAKWTTRSEFYVGTIFNDSYGAHKILGWLLTGRLFDDQRFPIVTLLFAVGLMVCIVQARRDTRARALLGAFTLSLLLFFGRKTFGSLIDLIPGFKDVQIHRFVAGVHLAGILIAGVGLGWLLQGVATVVGKLMPRQQLLVAGAAAVVAVAVLAPGWTERVGWDRHSAEMIRVQRTYDATDGRDLDKLVNLVKARGDGRAYAGLRDNWGTGYVIYAVPVSAWLADRNADTFGFTFRTIASLSTDVEVTFDEANPAQYEMFNVRYLLLPAERKPSVPAKLIGSSGRHRLYQVQTTGYLQVVDRAPAVEADRTNLQRATRAFRQSNLASSSVYPGVAFAGAALPPPTFSGATPPAGAPGTVIRQAAIPQDGIFSGTVEANRPAVVLLKASYDRRWTATVDGLPAKPMMMAPSLVGVSVPAGRHVVRFRYEPIDDYPLLLGIGVLTLLGLAIVPRRAAVKRRLQAGSRRSATNPGG